MTENNKIKAVFFDLDGTLLPLEQDYFLKKYISALARYVAVRGIDAEKSTNCLLEGTKAMLLNNGEKTNKEAFWQTFFALFGAQSQEVVDFSDEFYTTEFKNLRLLTSNNDFAKLALELAHKDDKKVILATNPVLPMQAQLERISWIGLNASDFDLITAYENSSYSKPNPKYYLEICEKISVCPDECIMIGNDESDDMKGAHEAGMRCWLCTDHRIMADNFVWTGERGSFEQMVRMLERL